jgi:anaerobic sulfite reductase subunit B
MGNLLTNEENPYVPFPSKIAKVIRHTDTEYTFRMEYEDTENVKPGSFFEISIPKFGEAPISVSGIEKGLLDFTIRRVGRVTNEIFENYEGSTLLIRGPYGNGFDVTKYYDKELIVVAGGTGVSPVRGVIDYFAKNPDKVKKMTTIAGFKSPEAILFKDDLKRWEDNMDFILTVDNNGGDDSYKQGMVTQYIPDIKVSDFANVAAIVVGPPVMMKFVVKALLDLGLKEDDIWISQERKMCCGLGKCGHCRINDTYICLSGPVFNYSFGKDLID